MHGKHRGYGPRKHGHAERGFDGPPWARSQRHGRRHGYRGHHHYRGNWHRPHMDDAAMTHDHGAMMMRPGFHGGPWMLIPLIIGIVVLVKLTFWLWPLALLAFVIFKARRWHHDGGAHFDDDPRKRFFYDEDDMTGKRKNDGMYIRTADGEWLEVVEPDADKPEIV